MTTTHSRFWAAGALLAGGMAMAVSGCQSPLERTTEEQMREQLIASHRKYLEATAGSPVIEIQRTPSDVENELTPERRAELDKMSGPTAYQGSRLDLGPDLTGKVDTDTVSMTLQRAVELAVRHNLDVKVAQLQPAIDQTQITQALAVFDAEFFTNLNWQQLDSPLPSDPGAINPVRYEQQNSLELQTGIRKLLYTGAEITAQTNARRISRDTSPAPTYYQHYYETDVLLSISQPLLRNFGADINRSNILLTQSQRAQSVQELRNQFLESIFQTEQAYWSLVFARQRLLIQQKLLERTVADRDQLKQRETFDVSPVRLTEANSFVELRRAEVIRARQDVRSASDVLKRLINSPELPLASETLIVPLDAPVEEPITFNLLDAVTTGLRHRPELQQATLQINDASIRQRVADNQRLPELNLEAAINFNGLARENPYQAYDDLAEGDYIDYAIGGQFSVPIGNRGPEALFQQRKLERRQAVVNYQRLAQEAVLDIKSALRDLHTTYELIGATRAARRAASDNLRALIEQEEAGVALTPEFLLDLKLSTQERLANAEIQETQAITQYNTSIARFYQALGTLLQRNGIDFEDRPEGARDDQNWVMAPVAPAGTPRDKTVGNR